jgi:molecular chaperone GrpE
MKKEKPEKSEKDQNIEQELDDLKNLLQRTQADFINHRRRVEEEKADFVKFSCANIIMQILPVLDNFSLAAKHVPEAIKNDNWVLGVEAIEKQLEQTLFANGLEKISVVGVQFDPNLHEAIQEVSNKKHKDNEIVSEELAGYMLHGKLIRPAKVIVNKIKK